MKLRYLVTLMIGSLFVAAACGGGETQSGAVAMPSPDDTTVSLENQVVVQVENEYGSAVVLYVTYGSSRRRLGQLNTKSVANYVVAYRSGGFWLEVESVLENRTVRSNGLDVPAGSAVRVLVNSQFEARMTPM